LFLDTVSLLHKKDLGFNDPRSFKGSIVCVTFGLWCVSTDPLPIV